ncbi:MAG: hypothetical protein ACLQQ4_15660 [Bacteroidia bacterium]
MNTDKIFEIIDRIQQYSISTWVLLIALILVFYSFFRKGHSTASRIFGFSLRPKIKWYSFIIGILFLILSQASNLIYSFSDRQMLPKSVFNRLKVNERVKWLIRIIPYGDEVKDRKLTLDSIKQLGKPADAYVFVADYEELRNYKVEEAVRKIGLIPQKYATIIMFPLEDNRGDNDENHLFPANVRGVIQVINRINNKYKNDTSYKFPFNYSFTSEESDNLKDTNIESWDWDNYKQYYSKFYDAVKFFNDPINKFSAREHMGRIDKDWNPLGVSCMGKNVDVKYKNIFKLDTISITNLGARVFFFPNLEIKNIKGKIMMEVDKESRIPDIGGKFDDLLSLMNK